MTSQTQPRDRFGRFVGWLSRCWHGELEEIDADRSALEDELNAWYLDEDSRGTPDPALYGQPYALDDLLELEQLQIAVIDLETGHVERRVSVESWLGWVGL